MDLESRLSYERRDILESVGILLISVCCFFIFELNIKVYYLCLCKLGISCRFYFLSSLLDLFAIICSNIITTALFLYLSAHIVNSTHLEKIALNNGMVLCTSLIIVIIYSVSGGALVALSPSHIAYPGAFSRSCVLVNNKGALPSPSMRRKVQDLGALYGCHHCGAFPPQYICDHMPPTVMYTASRSSSPQFLYPQCSSCSQFQGGTLSSCHVFGAFSKRGLLCYRYRPAFKRWLFWVPYFIVLDYLFDASGNIQRAQHRQNWGILSTLVPWL